MDRRSIENQLIFTCDSISRYPLSSFLAHCLPHRRAAAAGQTDRQSDCLSGVRLLRIRGNLSLIDGLIIEIRHNKRFAYRVVTIVLLQIMIRLYALQYILCF